MKSSSNLLSYIFLFLMTITFFSSCIDEDTDDCLPKKKELRIYFSYLDINEKYPRGIEPTEVDHLHLFIFDSNKKFVGEWIDNAVVFNRDYYMAPILDKGTYSMIAWGGNLENDFTLIPSNFIKGETTIDEAFLRLKRPVSDTIARINNNLFYAELNIAEVVNGDEHFTLPLKQHTNKINIVVNNMNGGDRYQLIINDNNGFETFTNRLASDSELHYSSLFTDNAINQITTSVRIMRLTESHRPQIIVYDRILKKNLFVEDLMGLLLDLRSIGAPVDFNDIHKYTINLALGTLAVTISIDQWNIERTYHNIGG